MRYKYELLSTVNGRSASHRGSDYATPSCELKDFCVVIVFWYKPLKNISNKFIVMYKNCLNIIGGSCGVISDSFVVILGPCNARYLCIMGAQTAEPTDGLTGHACPEGQYCPQGTAAPVACPVGTSSNSTGLGASGDCPGCAGGFYCDQTGLMEPTGPCSARSSMVSACL